MKVEKTITLTVQVKMMVDEETDIADVVNELDYTVKDTTGQANITDTDIIAFEEKEV